MNKIIARRDATLAARIVKRTELRYAAGADETLDRPAHVRAASGLARVAGKIVVIQDDANFLAVIDEHAHTIDSITLPAGEDGRRQFDDLRGNKSFKLDLEACTVIPSGANGAEAIGDLFVAFGSGSGSRRENVVVVDGWERDAPRVRLYNASALYAVLRETRDFAGSEMNIEGAVYREGFVKLFGRGNGAARDGFDPLDAACDLSWDELYAHLRDPRIAPPVPRNITQYDLGELDGVRLNFTDVALANSGGTLIFSAAAEDSPDAVRDGQVAGSVLGTIDDRGVRWARVTAHDDQHLRGKIEGVLLSSETLDRLLVVLDEDDPRTASLLCEVELTGSWFG